MRRGVSRRPSSPRSAPSASRRSPAARVAASRSMRRLGVAARRCSAGSLIEALVSERARVLRGKSRSRDVAKETMEAAAHHRREHVDPLPARRPRRVRDSVAVPIGARPVTHLPPDPESREWLATLRSSDARTHAEAVGRLHELLLRAARFEVRRRSAAAHHVGREQLDDVAHQSAHDALVAVLAKLDDFRGESRFTTWAYKFALLEAGVKMRRRAWNDREVT